MIQRSLQADIAGGGGVIGEPFVGSATGLYWDGSEHGTPLGTRTMLADRIELSAIQVTRSGVLIDRVGIGVQAASGAGTRIRGYIYLDNGRGAPGALYHATPDLAADAIAFVEQVLATPILLPRGLLWVGVHAESTPTVRARSVSAILPISTTTNPAGTSLFTVLQSGAVPFANPPPNPAPASTPQANLLGARVAVRLV